MENKTTSFFFEEGEIFNYNFRSWNPQERSAIYVLESALRPTIEQNKLSGKIELTILEDHAHIVYENIQPFEFVQDLMDLVNSTSRS